MTRPTNNANDELCALLKSAATAQRQIESNNVPSNYLKEQNERLRKISAAITPFVSPKRP